MEEITVKIVLEKIEIDDKSKPPKSIRREYSEGNGFDSGAYGASMRTVWETVYDKKTVYKVYSKSLENFPQTDDNNTYKIEDFNVDFKFNDIDKKTFGVGTSKKEYANLKDVEIHFTKKKGLLTNYNKSVSKNSSILFEKNSKYNTNIKK